MIEWNQAKYSHTIKGLEVSLSITPSYEQRNKTISDIAAKVPKKIGTPEALAVLQG